MQSLKTYSILLLFVALGLNVLAQQEIIPLGGNAFITHKKTVKITENGIEDWSDPNEIISFYVRISKPGDIMFSINEINKVEGKSVLEFSVNQQAEKITIDAETGNKSLIGPWKIKDTGYVKVTIKGISKNKKYFPSLKRLTIIGTAVDENTAFVKTNTGAFFYWGRRGPSVHLNYQMPENIDAEWFYNEITVPKGNDVIGSYFMANGFAEGYFGIQVNSLTERRVLFSIWSPFKTDDPKSIPESHKIKLVKKGESVYAGEFGNEGSGGQSYLKYNWKAGNTYKFLVHAAPLADSTTQFTAYFFAPELNKWLLIASFKRPKTQTYLKHLHSFLENFDPENGDKTRKALYTNQWIYTTKGEWQSLNSATFTVDNTGKIGYRKDFAGGLENNGYFLKNGGFFNDFTIPKRTFFPPPVLIPNQKVVDFSKLPN